MQDLIISQSSFVLKGATIQTALSKFAGLAEIIQRRQLEAPREFRAMIVEHAQHSNWSVILFDDEGIPTKSDPASLRCAQSKITPPSVSTTVRAPMRAVCANDNAGLSSLARRRC
jgi:hypothetical protein